jgi:hypothetical protein
MIMGGIHPRLLSKLSDDADRWLPSDKNDSGGVEAARNYIRDEISKRYEQPFITI